MYPSDENPFEIKLSGRKATIVAICIISFVYFLHHYIYYKNPTLKNSITALESDDPFAIGEALYQAQKLTMSKGHKLIPYILPLLKDNRELPDNIEKKIILEIQSTPGAIGGMGERMKGSFTLGFTSALTLQSLVMLDVQNKRFVGGKARDKIVEYIIENFSINDNELAISNGVAAVRQIHDKKLVPFWFRCLELESEQIKAHALSGLFHYVHDRSNGIFAWNPEKEITRSMYSQLKDCQHDPSGLIQRQAELVVQQLTESGLQYDKI
jgi:hypothetical protein